MKDRGNLPDSEDGTEILFLYFQFHFVSSRKVEYSYTLNTLAGRGPLAEPRVVTRSAESISFEERSRDHSVQPALFHRGNTTTRRNDGLSSCPRGRGGG